MEERNEEPKKSSTEQVPLRTVLNNSKDITIGYPSP
jgi:hypothetical protein